MIGLMMLLNFNEVFDAMSSSNYQEIIKYFSEFKEKALVDIKAARLAKRCEDVLQICTQLKSMQVIDVEDIIKLLKSYERFFNEYLCLNKYVMNHEYFKNKNIVSRVLIIDEKY